MFEQKEKSSIIVGMNSVNVVLENGVWEQPGARLLTEGVGGIVLW